MIDATPWVSPTRKTFRFPNHGQIVDATPWVSPTRKTFRFPNLGQYKNSGGSRDGPVPARRFYSAPVTVTPSMRVTAGTTQLSYCRVSREKRMWADSAAMVPLTDPPDTGITRSPSCQ